MTRNLCFLLFVLCTQSWGQGKINSHKIYTINELKLMSAPDTPETLNIKKTCKENIWCFHDKLIKKKDPSLCPTINNHWTDVDQGVVGSCYQLIATEVKDCSICNKIVKNDTQKYCLRTCQ